MECEPYCQSERSIGQLRGNRIHKRVSHQQEWGESLVTSTSRLLCTSEQVNTSLNTAGGTNTHPQTLRLNSIARVC
jgi:hypothetical protein